MRTARIRGEKYLYGLYSSKVSRFTSEKDLIEIKVYTISIMDFSIRDIKSESNSRTGK